MQSTYTPYTLDHMALVHISSVSVMAYFPTTHLDARKLANIGQVHAIASLNTNPSFCTSASPNYDEPTLIRTRRNLVAYIKVPNVPLMLLLALANPFVTHTSKHTRTAPTCIEYRDIYKHACSGLVKCLARRASFLIESVPDRNPLPDDVDNVELVNELQFLLVNELVNSLPTQDGLDSFALVADCYDRIPLSPFWASIITDNPEIYKHIGACLAPLYALPQSRSTSPNHETSFDSNEYNDLIGWWVFDTRVPFGLVFKTCDSKFEQEFNDSNKEPILDWCIVQYALLQSQIQQQLDSDQLVAATTQNPEKLVITDSVTPPPTSPSATLVVANPNHIHTSNSIHSIDSTTTSNSDRVSPTPGLMNWISNLSKRALDSVPKLTRTSPNVITSSPVTSLTLHLNSTNPVSHPVYKLAQNTLFATWIPSSCPCTPHLAFMTLSKSPLTPDSIALFSSALTMLSIHDTIDIPKPSNTLTPPGAFVSLYTLGRTFPSLPKNCSQSLLARLLSYVYTSSKLARMAVGYAVDTSDKNDIQRLWVAQGGDQGVIVVPGHGTTSQLVKHRDNVSLSTVADFLLQDAHVNS